MNHDRIQTGLIVNQSPWSATVQFAYVRSIDRQIQCAKHLEMVNVEPNAPVEIAFELWPNEAQELFNRLWALGYRPADGTGNSGHIAALQNHLEDMRRLVFSDPKP